MFSWIHWAHAQDGFCGEKRQIRFPSLPKSIVFLWAVASPQRASANIRCCLGCVCAAASWWWSPIDHLGEHNKTSPMPFWTRGIWDTLAPPRVVWPPCIFQSFFLFIRSKPALSESMDGWRIWHQRIFAGIFNISFVMTIVLWKLSVVQRGSLKEAWHFTILPKMKIIHKENQFNFHMTRM